MFKKKFFSALMGVTMMCSMVGSTLPNVNAAPINNEIKLTSYNYKDEDTVAASNDVNTWVKCWVKFKYDGDQARPYDYDYRKTQGDHEISVSVTQRSYSDGTARIKFYIDYYDRYGNYIDDSTVTFDCDENGHISWSVR